MKKLVNAIVNGIVRHEKKILVGLIVIVGLVYSFISIQTHNHFQTFGWDLGFFDQIIWKASRGDIAAYSTIAKENLLADHFQVVLYFVAPFYWITNDIRSILVVQAFLVTVAAWPLYWLSKKITGHLFFSFAIICSYLFFIGTQWTVLNEFHQMAFAPLFLSILFYALHTNNIRLSGIGMLGLIATKEEMSLLVSSLGALIWLYYRWKIAGILTTLAGVGVFFLLIYAVMPALSVRGTYSHFDFGDAGYTPVDVVTKTLNNPLFFFQSMVSPPVKLQTVFQSYAAFGFLPLLSPVFQIPIIEQFVTRFIYAGPQFTKWVNVNHHAAPLGILFAVSVIYAFRSSSKRTYTLVAIYLISASILQDILLHAPIHSVFKKTLYETSDWMRNNNEVLRRVPDNASVAAQNSLVPHLSQRNEIYILPELSEAQYVVVDLHDGPNKFAPFQQAEMKAYIEALITSGRYGISVQKGEAMLLQRR